MPDLPELPDIPGKSLVVGMTKRAGSLAMAAAGGAIAVGGFVVRRALARRGDPGEESEAGRRGPAGETVTAPPPAVERPASRPRPRTEKPKAAPVAKTNGGKGDAPPKQKAAPKAKEGKAKPKAAKAGVEPPLQTGTDAPPKPSVEPGNISFDRDHPHRALSNPVGDPDETEYPDPFETREDPRDPVDPDEAPFGAEAHPPTGSVSTSEPPPALDPEVGDRAEPPERENLDQ